MPGRWEEVSPDRGKGEKAGVGEDAHQPSGDCSRAQNILEKNKEDGQGMRLKKKQRAQAGRGWGRRLCPRSFYFP